MAISDPTYLDYTVFPPGMLMSVAAVCVRLRDSLGDPEIDTWRKTLEVFASSTGVSVERLPAQGPTICLHLGGPGGVHARSKGQILNWLSASREVQSLQVLNRSHRRAPGITLFIDRASAVLIA